MHGEAHAGGGFRPNRVEALSDGVFAIVVTLLVLEIKVPIVEPESAAAELPHALAEKVPLVLAYAVSFIVLGVYWVAHHNQFHYIRRVDRALLWINVAFLLFVAFVPFTAALVGHYPDVPIAHALYGADLIVIGVALYAHWAYATGRGRLVDGATSPELVRLAKRRIAAPPVFYAIAIALAFVSPVASLVVYLVVPVLGIIPGRIDRHWKPVAHSHAERKP